MRLSLPTEPLMTRATWLQRMGFGFDPFEYEAADEVLSGDPYLERYFVPFHYFEELKEPRTSFLFTPRGCGKSANRIQLEQWCAETLQRPDQRPNILVVLHDDFLRVLADISLESHCQAILHQAVPALLDALFRYFPDAIAHLPPREYEDLRWFVQHYADRLVPSGLRGELRELGTLPHLATPEEQSETTKRVADVVASLVKGPSVEPLPKAVETMARLFTYEPKETSTTGEISSSERLTHFVAIARAAGIEHIFVLIDRVDEFEWTANHPERQAELLYPLIATASLLSTLCFKFFLPSELLPTLRSRLGPDGFREDRLNIINVEWQDAGIAQVLFNRLYVASDGRYSHFTELVNFESAPWDVDARLIRFAHGSPRDLVRICKRIVNEHTRLQTDQLYIPDIEIDDALRWFSRARVFELYGSEWLAKLLQLRRTPFTLDVAADALKLSEVELEALLKVWRGKGLVKHLPRDPAHPEAALLFHIADPRALLMWEEEHL